MSGVRRRGRPVVEVGAQVRFGGVRWQVVALSRQGFHLVDEGGADQVVLAGHLFADPGFAVLGAEPVQAVPQWGLFETAPVVAREKAMAWLRHIREVECGLPDGPDSGGVMRAEYDPQRWTLAERERAKAAELTALGFARVSDRTVQKMRLAYRKQGLWGLVDHRSTRGRSGGGRQDERVVAVIREVLRGQRGRSKGTVKGLMPLVARLLDERYKGAVTMPSRATFYRLVHEIAHPADHPATRVRTVPVTDDGRGFTPTVALRPGEQVQIDTTRLDVLARFDDGSVGRPELTIAVDVATRAILAGVLCPAGTQAVDAALLLAEMAVPHPARPAWADALRFTHSAVLPAERLLSLDERLRGAAARPVVVPETVVVDRGKVFLSKAFTGACEALGISVQAAPPFAPTAKGIVERTFGSINTLFCQHLPGYTGSDVTRRGKDAAREACYSVVELQELLDEWVVHYHHRPHQGLRHPLLPKVALSPNQMWAALVAVAGYVPVPLTGNDYLELLPVRWQAITEHGIRLHHRTYDHDLLSPHRGQPSTVAGRRGKWEIHYNPHDARQVWIRLPDGQLTEIPWIHRDHTHQPFNDRTWQYLRTITDQQAGHNAVQAEAALAEALDALMRRARAGQATAQEQHLLNRTSTVRTPPPRRSQSRHQAPPPQPETLYAGEDSLDGLDQDQETGSLVAEDETVGDPAVPVSGYGLYDAEEEALKW
ncbi:Mu transposase C-terminal domain-containing protein [Streptomyces pakalii]|uniref:Mu transposase C-terminal domain-containing protein n=1 Tax=Streptomyces pakalii TaxID=3036494 RepID=A0ABT7DHB1_9ACTN|nr:Mu transposase C-terminal domain-containing protein [Streptomyces pakalii]MDJ1645219.1 Mu transposase C-terminal domain-containing protein [Streptomyces pakalii]